MYVYGEIGKRQSDRSVVVTIQLCDNMSITTDQSLQRSIQSLEESIKILKDTSDTLKTNNVKTRYLSNTMLQCNRNHYLATEFDMERATKDLNEEIDPIMNSLQDHLSKQLDRLKREINQLQEKYSKNQELLDLENADAKNSQNAGLNKRMNTPDVMMGPLSDEQFSELKMLAAQIQSKKLELNNL